MSRKPDILGMTGLLFFGSMSSSNFHEIKNALAIINENAGLLDDIAHSTGEDISIDPERLKNVAAKITKQVKRADGIIKNINRFSHSVDKPEERIDLGETVAFVTKLSEKLAAIRGITVKTVPLTCELNITTSPFFLENLVWICLDFAMSCAGEGKTVELVTEKSGEGGCIRFARLENLDQENAERFASREEMVLLNAIDANIAADPDAGELIIFLPKSVQHGSRDL